MSWWHHETAAADGHITLSELALLGTLLVLRRVADRREADESRARFLRERHTIVVPREISELELLQAVATAVNDSDEKVRGYTWYREAVERGEDPESDGLHDDYFGRATCDQIACALMGVADEWKLKHQRRVVAPLGRLLRAGLIERGERNGVPYGYEVTLEGVGFLVDAGAIDRLAEVV